MPHATPVKRPVLRACILVGGITLTALCYGVIGSLLIGATLGPVGWLCCGMIGAGVGAFVTAAA